MGYKKLIDAKKVVLKWVHWFIPMDLGFSLCVWYKNDGQLLTIKFSLNLMSKNITKGINQPPLLISVFLAE